MAVMCDWTVKPSPYNPEGTSRLERGRELVMVHWHPAGAMRDATLYRDGQAHESLRKDDKARRRKLEAWVRGPMLTPTVT